MKISVLMPTYECPPDLLYKSISSVFMQRHTDFELIIKDGSTENPAIDNSAYLNTCLKQHPDRVKYVCSPETPPRDQLGNYKHNGFYEALNTCIKMSSGDILCLLCSDDEVPDQFAFGDVNEEFEKHGSSYPFLLYGSCDWITRSGLNFDTKRPPDDLTFEKLLRDYTLYTPALFWNKAVHQAHGYFSEHLAWCADMDFWLKCLRRGLHMKRSPRTLGRYRVWETSQARANEMSLKLQGQFIQKMYTTAYIAGTIK